MNRPAARGAAGICTRTAIAACCAAIAAVACTGSLFQSKAAPVSIYLLSAARGAAQAATSDSPSTTVAGAAVATPPARTLPADLAVLRPRVRTGLDTDRIAVLYADRHLDYVADARWSGPLDDVVQDLAVQAFRSNARLRNVSADASAFAGNYWLEIEVIDFEAQYVAATAAPIIHVHLAARLGAAGDRRILGTFDADAQQPASDNRLTAIIDAYGTAVDGALAGIVANTVRTLGGALEH